MVRLLLERLAQRIPCQRIPWQQIQWRLVQWQYQVGNETTYIRKGLAKCTFYKHLFSISSGDRLAGVMASVFRIDCSIVNRGYRSNNKRMTIKLVFALTPSSTHHYISIERVTGKESGCVWAIYMCTFPSVSQPH